jgi:predicted transposase YbfD/YdcC
MLYTVKKTLQKIHESGNHYTVKVKANQPKLKTALEETLVFCEPISSFREEAIIRGRLEIRQTFLYIPQNLPQGWDSVKIMAYVQRQFLSKEKEHKTDSLYISDVNTSDAALMAEIIRSHWNIENKLHYTKDVIMHEDKGCTKNKAAAPNLALFRNFAFNILKKTNNSIKYATEIFANYNVKELLNVLFRT